LIEILATIQPSEIAWVYCNNLFYFSRDTKPDYRTALSQFAELSPAIPHGLLNEVENVLILPFEDEYIYTPYSTALKGLRDLEVITDDTLLKFKTFHRKASLIFKEIVAFEKKEILNSLDTDLEFSVGRFRYA
jgi:hypothetical protein